MTNILKEKVTNKNGVSWIRTHGIDSEGSALCSYAINPDVNEISEGIGQITCPDCIELIKVCKTIPPGDLMPEYENDLHSKRFEK